MSKAQDPLPFRIPRKARDAQQPCTSAAAANDAGCNNKGASRSKQHASQRQTSRQKTQENQQSRYSLRHPLQQQQKPSRQSTSNKPKDSNQPISTVDTILAKMMQPPTHNTKREKEKDKEKHNMTPKSNEDNRSDSAASADSLPRLNTFGDRPLTVELVEQHNSLSKSSSSFSLASMHNSSTAQMAQEDFMSFLLEQKMRNGRLDSSETVLQNLILQSRQSLEQTNDQIGETVSPDEPQLDIKCEIDRNDDSNAPKDSTAWFPGIGDGTEEDEDSNAQLAAFEQQLETQQSTAPVDIKPSKEKLVKDRKFKIKPVPVQLPMPHAQQRKRKGPRTPPGSPPGLRRLPAGQTPQVTRGVDTQDTSPVSMPVGANQPIKEMRPKSSCSGCSASSCGQPSLSKEQGTRPSQQGIEHESDEMMVQRLASMANVDPKQLKSCLNPQMLVMLRTVDPNIVLNTVSSILQSVAKAVNTNRKQRRKRREDECDKTSSIEMELDSASEGNDDNENVCDQQPMGSAEDTYGMNVMIKQEVPTTIATVNLMPMSMMSQQQPPINAPIPGLPQLPPLPPPPSMLLLGPSMMAAAQPMGMMPSVSNAPILPVMSHLENQRQIELARQKQQQQVSEQPPISIEQSITVAPPPPPPPPLPPPPPPSDPTDINVSARKMSNYTSTPQPMYTQPPMGGMVPFSAMQPTTSAIAISTQAPIMSSCPPGYPPNIAPPPITTMSSYPIPHHTPTKTANTEDTHVNKSIPKFLQNQVFKNFEPEESMFDSPIFVQNTNTDTTLPTPNVNVPPPVASVSNNNQNDSTLMNVSMESITSSGMGMIQGTSSNNTVTLSSSSAIPTTSVPPAGLPTGIQLNRPPPPITTQSIVTSSSATGVNIMGTLMQALGSHVRMAPPMDTDNREKPRPSLLTQAPPPPTSMAEPVDDNQPFSVPPCPPANQILSSLAAVSAIMQQGNTQQPPISLNVPPPSQGQQQSLSPVLYDRYGTPLPKPKKGDGSIGPSSGPMVSSAPIANMQGLRIQQPPQSGSNLAGPPPNLGPGILNRPPNMPSPNIGMQMPGPNQNMALRPDIRSSAPGPRGPGPNGPGASGSPMGPRIPAPGNSFNGPPPGFHESPMRPQMSAPPPMNTPPIRPQVPNPLDRNSPNLNRVPGSNMGPNNNMSMGTPRPNMNQNMRPRGPGPVPNINDLPVANGPSPRGMRPMNRMPMNGAPGIMGPRPGGPRPGMGPGPRMWNNTPPRGPRPGMRPRFQGPRF